RQHDQHAVRDRQRTARESCSVPARDEGNAMTMARAYDRLHLGGGRRKYHEAGPLAETGQTVRLERQQLARRGQQAVSSHRARDLVAERRYHATIDSSNSFAKSSAVAARGESFVTRCCGSVPSTSVGMSLVE